MKVDVIEAGFPIASNGDFEAVRAISEIVTESVVCGLARAGAGDIERCGEAIKKARRGRIHTFISTSPVHMKWKLQMEPEQVLELVTRSVTQARNLTDDVEWSAEDATRTDATSCCAAWRPRSAPGPRPSTCPTRSATPIPASTPTSSAT
jgi:2-isopropylmalate synthase